MGSFHSHQRGDLLTVGGAKYMTVDDPKGRFMARLLVEARTAEQNPPGAVLQRVRLGVSVSRVDNGTPVTGLKVGNFIDFQIATAFEQSWQPDDTQLSGCYQVEIMLSPVADSAKGFATCSASKPGPAPALPPRVVDQGQTILDLVSLGR
jgi:hypothetical protein